ncbi:hypothetical protein ACK3TF_004168 [Chlorella vulgaris]
MQAPRNLGSLAEAVAQAVLQDDVEPALAAALCSIFPAAAALRLSVLTGDSQVLASVGSLLTPGRLALALHPFSATVGGAAIAKRAPMYLTQETVAGLPCYDFEGDAVLSVSILQPGSQPTDTAPCIGALLLSFAAGVQPDAQHAGNLQLLAAVLAPCLGRAAAVLVEHCSLLIGAAASGAEAQAADELASHDSAGSHVSLTSSSAGEEEEVEREEVELRAGLERHTRQPAQAGAAVGGQGKAEGQPGWASGECRDDHKAAYLPQGPGSPPPSAVRLAATPGSEIQDAEAAQAAGAAAGTAAAHQAAAGAASSASSSSGAQSARRDAPASQAGGLMAAVVFGNSRSPGGAQPTSPSLGKGRAATRPACAVDSELATASSVGSCSGGGISLGKAPSQLLKVSSSGFGSAGGEAALAGGLSMWRLLRFAHPQLEQRFAAWHASQLARSDKTSLGLTAALQLALASRSSPGRLLAAQGAPLRLAALAGPLALLVLLHTRRSAYMRHRDALLAMLYLGCSARLCLQGPLQLLLFVCQTWPLLSWTSDTRAFPESLRCCLAFALAVVAPLVLLHRLELQARHKFLACLPSLSQPS